MQGEKVMTQDEIIQMARHIATTLGSRMCDENGDTHGEELYCMAFDDIVDSIKLVAAKEREACAKLCDEARAARLAEQIRARGEA
jgi:hypothetical protein